ncbi:hypothetical protein G6F57_023491 [Rhizopus arrhizus]|nr:hypothetical protein G6F57_023491 [Rhizopus arrhizus]
MGWLPVISMTTTLAVSGAWVAAARKAAIDTSTSTRWSTPSPANCQMCWPIPAPVVRAGVKMPPGMPAQYEATVAASLARPKPAGAVSWHASRSAATP